MNKLNLPFYYFRCVSKNSRILRWDWLRENVPFLCWKRIQLCWLWLWWEKRKAPLLTLFLFEILAFLKSVGDVSWIENSWISTALKPLYPCHNCTKIESVNSLKHNWHTRTVRSTDTEHLWERGGRSGSKRPTPVGSEQQQRWTKVCLSKILVDPRNIYMTESEKSMCKELF